MKKFSFFCKIWYLSYDCILNGFYSRKAVSLKKMMSVKRSREASHNGLCAKNMTPEISAKWVIEHNNFRTRLHYVCQWNRSL